MSRVTRKQVDQHAAVVSSMLRDGLRVVPEGRYGYIGLDLYDGHGMVRTIATGLSTSQAKLVLTGMYEALTIVGR
jgi:hypothetical protein